MSYAHAVKAVARKADRKPCLGCTDRHTACHQTCSRFLENREQVKAETLKYLDSVREQRICDKHTYQTHTRLKAHSKAGQKCCYGKKVEKYERA